MALPQTSTHRYARGFSLIEVLMVLGLISILAGFSAFMTLRDYRAASLRSDRDSLITALQKAREESMNGNCFGSSCTGPVAHGVHIGAGKYTIFQGPAFVAADPENEVVRFSPAISVSGFSDVVFVPLSGMASAGPSATITLTDTIRSSRIYIGSEGRISWDD